jgi:hypothetical protein
VQLAPPVGLLPLRERPPLLKVLIDWLWQLDEKRMLARIQPMDQEIKIILAHRSASDRRMPLTRPKMQEYA